MRKLLLLFLGVFCLLCPVKADVRYALAPVGFEEGVLPDGWTQENIEGTVNWQVEGGPGVSLADPVGAKSGDYRLAIRRAKGATSGFVTRLISPAMDISEMQNPQLCFAHAQVATFDYFDTLRVWYRTTADAQWTLLEEFASPIPAWKNETLPLEKYLQGTAYQIAFEVEDHAGKGVVLDDICVLQPSICQKPLFQMVQPSSRSAFIEFVAGGTGYGSQADLYDLIVSDSALADPSAAQASEVLYMQKGMTDNSLTITGLDAYTTYYAYLRTNCADNASGYTEWTSTQFQTSMLNSLPYVENFNQKKTTSDYAVINGWTFATDIDNAGVPFVYVGASSTYKQNYSVDSTSYLAFVGAASTSVSPVPKGKYVYAATPELDGNLSQCEVSFWGTAYSYIANGATKDYAAELTVGVMTNPADYTTFTPVKTVTVESGYQFKHFVVSLSDYQGNGKYVALRSAAAKDNVFFVDNFSVAVAAVPVPEDIRVFNVLPSGFNVSTALHGADSWNIKVAAKYVRNAASLADADCLVSQTGLTASSFHVASADLAGKTVCVYLQAVKNGVTSDWAFPVTLRVPTVGSLPITLDMNSDNAEISIYTFNNEIHYRSSAKTVNGIYFPLRSFDYYPTRSTSSPTYNGGHLDLRGTDNYFVLPYVENMDSLVLSFRLSVGSWSSSYTSYTGQSRVAVGVMTDPYDLSTFVEVARFEGDDTKYIKCETDFLSYTGKGHYVAVRAVEANTLGYYNTYNALDDIVLKKIPTCRLPKNVVSDPQVSTASLSWDAQAMTKWLVSLYGDRSLTTLLQDSVVTAPAVTFSGLASGTTYYFTIRTICGTDTIEAEDIYSFTTLIGVPFMEKFTTKSIPNGWSMWQGLLADVFNGSTLTSSTYCWNFGTQSGVTTDGFVAYTNIYGVSRKHWLMMPELYINTDADDAVQLSFEAALTAFSPSKRNSGTDDQFAVVISTDNGATWTRTNATVWNNATDSTTDFVLNDLPDDKMQKYTIDLSKYIGTKVRIAFYAESTVSNADNYLLIDNVSVNTFDVNCQGIKSLSAVALSETEADISWTVGGAQSLHLDVYVDKSTTPLFSGDVTASPYRLTGLNTNTLYHVVAHQSCDLNGDTLTTSFRTQCGAYTPAELGTVDFSDPDALTCWTVGIGDTTGVGKASLTVPETRSITGFGKVLYLNKPKSTSSSYYGNNYYAILPPLNIDDITKYQVVFDAAVNTTKADTANVAKLYVGVITDPSDLSTFEVTDTLALQYAADSLALRSYAIGFDNYQGDYLGEMGKYIVLMVAAPRDYSDIAIVDNVRIEAVDACHQVLNAEVSDIRTDAATLRWTSAAGSARVVVSTVLCNPDTVSDFVFDDIIANTGSVTVTNLSAGTAYYAYIRAICGEGDTARWSGHTVFSTSYGVPYAENFSAGNSASDWTVYKKSFPAGADTLDISSVAPATGTTAWYITKVPSGITGMDDNAARVEIYTSSYDALFVSPAISLPELADMDNPIAVSFKVAKSKYYSSSSSSSSEVEDSSDDKFSVMVSLDGGATWTRSNSTVWASDGSGDYNYNDFSLKAKRCRVDLSKYAGKSIRVGFFTESTYYKPDTYLYLDSVAIDHYQPTCDGIINLYVIADSTSTQSASLFAKATNLSDTIEYVYAIDSVDFATAQPVHADSSLIHLSGLQHSSTYAVWARTLCAAGDTSAWFGPVYFDTKCMAPVPVLYNFDDTDNRHLLTSYYYMENCWETRYTSSSSMPYLHDNTSYYTYAYSGSSALGFYMGNYSSNYSLVALPMVEGNLDTLQLSFMARAGSATSSGFSCADDTYLHSVMVGTMDNLNDTSTFRLIKEVVVESIASDAAVSDDPAAFWRQQVVSLEGAQGKYIVFFQKKGSKANYIYIDDVRISKRLDCPLVDALSVDSITDTRARVHWTSQADNFVVTVVSEAGKKTYNPADTLLLLTDLKSDMRYTISVASVCGTDTTLAVQRSFTTRISLPFSEDFSEGLPGTWLRLSGNILNGGATSNSGSYSDWTFSSTNTYGIPAPKMMWELTNEEYDPYDYDYYYYKQNSVLATPNVLLNTQDATNPILLSFDMALTSSYSSSAPYASSTNDRKFAVLVSEDDAATWTKIDSLVWGTDTTFARRFDSIPNTSTRYTFDFSAYRNKSIRIAFYAYSPDDDASGYLHLSNVALKEQNLNCLKPTGLQATGLTTDSATLCWNSDAATFQLQVAADAKFNKLVVDSVLSDTALAVGTLTVGTGYYARVRVICGKTSYSDWTETLKFKTQYGVPFVEDFTTISTAFPVDWGNYKNLTLDKVLGTASPFDGAAAGTAWKYNSTYNNKALEDGMHAAIELSSSNSDAWMVTPVIDMTKVSGNYVVFSFDAALTYAYSVTAPTSSDNQRFYLAVSEDGGATWSKENLVTWSNMASDSTQYTLSSIPAGNGKNYKFDFSKYAGKTIQIAFGVYASSNYNRLHIDNVRLERLSSLCFGVENVQTLTVTTASAQMRIMPSQSDSVWQYLYGISGFAVADSLAHCHNTDTVAFTLSNLAAGTSYDVYVRSVCAVGDTSEWAGPYTVLTTHAMPFVEEFAGISTSKTLPLAWTRYASVPVATLLSKEHPFANATIPTSDIYWGYNSYNSNAFADDDHIGVELYYSNSNAWLLTPQIEVAALEEGTAIRFSFDAALTKYNSSVAPTSSDNQRFYLVVSEDGGVTWSKENLVVWSNAASDSARYTLSSIPTGNGKNYKFDFSKYAGKTIQIAFGVYASSNDNRLHIDNIRLEEITSLCFEVENVSLLNATAATATLNITPAAFDSVWQYTYCESGAAFTGSLPIFATDTTVFTIDQLNSNTAYDVYVRSICAVGDTAAWSGPYAVKTAQVLPFAEEFSTIATVMPADWSQYKGLTLNNILTSERPFKEAKETSAWGYSASYNANALTDANHIGIELYSSNSNSWLVSPRIDLSQISEESLVRFSFDAALTYWYSSDVPKATDNQKFYVMVSEDGGVTWNKENVIVWSNAAADSARYTLSSIPAGNGKNYKLDFSKYAGKNIQIAFGIYALSNDNWLHIDNIRLEETESLCIGVNSVYSQKITSASAQMRIVPSQSDSVWQYLYGISGFAVADSLAHCHNTDTVVFTLSNLAAGTSYDVYVRSVCAVGDTSEWSDPYTVRTIHTLPFTEDFNTVDTSFPEAWTTYSSLSPSSLFAGGSFEDATQSSYGWQYSATYNANAFSGDKHVSVSLTYSSSYWLVSPVVDMTDVDDASNVVLSFDVALTEPSTSAHPSSADDQEFYVVVSEDGGKTWTRGNATIWSESSTADYSIEAIPNGAGQSYTFNMNKYIGKAVQVAFGAYQNSSYYIDEVRIHLDNIRLYADANHCFDIETVQQTNATTSSISLRIGDSNRAATAWQYVYGVKGFNRADSAIHNTAALDFTLTGLNPNISYDVYVRSACGSNDTTAWVGPFAFATAYILPFNEDFAGISTTKQIPDNWLTYSDKSLTVSALCDGTKFFANETPLASSGSTTKWGYNASFTKYGFADEDHIGVELWSYYSGSWLLTPAINLSAVAEDEMVVFSFDAALTKYDASDAPVSSDNQRFCIMVSEDAGTTWSKENTILWSNATADNPQYKLSDIANGSGTPYLLDFSKYKGKTIRIAFGIEVSENDNYLHIDNVSLYAASSICIAPVRVSQVSATTQSLNLHIETEKTDAQWQYAYGPAGFALSDAAAKAVTVSLDFTLSGLNHSTGYDVYVRTVCGEEDSSKWVGPFGFTTDYAIPFYEDFADISTTMQMPDKWLTYAQIPDSLLFNGSKSFATETPLQVNGTTSKWGYNSSYTENALSDKNHLSVEISSSYYYSNSGCWAVTPAIDLTIADDANHIFFTFDAALSSTYSTSAPSSSDGQRFYVAVSEDGGATWNKKNAILWSNAPADSADYMLSEIPNKAGTSYQLDFSRYAGKVVQIAFGVMCEQNSTRLHIDNVHLYATSSVCFGVKKCTLKSTTATSATLAFVPNDEAPQWQYAYGTAGFMLSGKTPVQSVDTTVFTINGLAAQTQYDVYIRSVCAPGDTSAWAGPYTVTTAYGVPFVETFDDMANVLFPAGWTRYKSSVGYADLVAGKASFDTTEPYTTTSTSESGWGYNSSYTDKALADANHVTVEIYSLYSKSWMLSPAIDLTTVADNEALEFSFDAALTYWNSDKAPTSTSSQRFYIIVSEDGGATWTAANTTTWGEYGSDYLLSSIPVGAGTSYQFDFAKYAGKTIRIAFGVEASSNDNRLHLDNIALKRVVTRDYAASVCNSGDYVDAYFSISRADLVLGSTTYTTKLLGQNNAPDTVLTLTLSVYPAERVAIHDTICEGYMYQNNGFNFLAQKSTVVPLTLTSHNGCDSLVELHLEVIPTTYLDTTIMACQSYTYKGTTYYSDRVFTDTLSATTGCDSIVRTFLRISATGDTETMWRTSICQGDSYNDEVFSGLNKAGTYTQTVLNDYGCDSTITLHLLVADAKGAVYDTIRQTDLPYLYEGEVFLGENTKVGDYQHDVQSSCGQITLFMHVYLETAIANTSVQTLHLTPNPAKVGEPVQIVSDIISDKDYTISVFSSVGQLVYHSRVPQIYLPGFTAAGIYTVRIVNAKAVYQTKLLVQ